MGRQRLARQTTLTTIPTGAPSIRVDRVSFSLLVSPRLRPAIRFADVGANLQRLQIVHRGAAVIAFSATISSMTAIAPSVTVATASSCLASSGSVS